MTALYFDTIAYLQEARDAGVSQKAAEVQAKYIQLTMNEAFKTTQNELNLRDLVTKQDLRMAEQSFESKLELKIEQVRKEIEQSKNSLMIWLFSLLAAYSGIIAGIMGRGFHWW